MKVTLASLPHVSIWTQTVDAYAQVHRVGAAPLQPVPQTMARQLGGSPATSRPAGETPMMPERRRLAGEILLPTPSNPVRLFDGI